MLEGHRVDEMEETERIGNGEKQKLLDFNVRVLGPNGGPRKRVADSWTS